ALGAVLASQRADVARQHHAVTLAPHRRFLGAFPGAAGALTDLQRDLRRAARAHDDRVHGLDVLADLGAVLVLGLDQVLPGHLAVLAEHISDRSLLHPVVDLDAARGEVLLDVDLVRARDTDDRHGHDAAPDGRAF